MIFVGLSPSASGRQPQSSIYCCEIGPQLGAQSLDPYEQDLGFRPLWIDAAAAADANAALLAAGPGKAPRWTRRDTFVLQKLMKQSKR